MMWISSDELSLVANISARKAHRALARSASATSPWRGAALIVREVHGRGGRSGVSYQVLASSLPTELQERLKVL
jgi:hypothetical protein